MLIAEDREVDIFVASKIGSLKHIKYHTDAAKNTKKCIENLVDIKSLQKEDGVTRMSWGNQEQTEILLARKNQQIHVYDTTAGFSKGYVADFGDGLIVGLGRYKRRLLVALSSGMVKIWSKKTDTVIDTGGKLDAMKIYEEDPTMFATGGEENDLKIWRVGESNPIFIAKNLPHDWLQLRRPVWVSDLTFLPGEGGRLTAACSRHGYVRLYDSRAQRRPVCNVEFSAMAATCITPSFDDRQVLVGFGRGQLHQVDLRKGKPDKGYKGCTGAVTDISLVTRERLIVSTSLDRQLRIHQHHSKEMVYRQYLTSKLTSVLVQNANSTPLKNVEEQEIKEETGVKEEVGDELDDLFENMETIGGRPKRTKVVPAEIEVKRVKPSTEGSTDVSIDKTELAIMKLLKSTQNLKKKKSTKRPLE